MTNEVPDISGEGFRILKTERPQQRSYGENAGLLLAEEPTDIASHYELHKGHLPRLLGARLSRIVHSGLSIAARRNASQWSLIIGSAAAIGVGAFFLYKNRREVLEKKTHSEDNEQPKSPTS